MTTMSELGNRAAAQGHDITAVSAAVPGAEQSKRVALRRVQQFRVEADAAASTTIAERGVLGFPSSEFPGGVKLISVHLRASSAVTASSTLFATDTFVARDSGGINNLTSATIKTDITANGGVGSLTAFAPYASTLSTTVANILIAADGCLTLTRAKASTGTQMPECVYAVVVESL